MEQKQLLQALARLDLMEMMDLYFLSRTGHYCFTDEVLPVNLLASLYEVETYLHQYNETMISNSVLRTEDEEEA